MKLHIESIEGGTYLATVENNAKQELAKDNGKPIAFHCLNEIKEHYDGQDFEQVWLKQNTPYDEMCGLDNKHEKLELLIDWH